MKRFAFPTLVSLAASSLLACSGVSDPGLTNPGMPGPDSGAGTDSSITTIGDDSSTPPPDTGTTPVTSDAGVDATLSGSDAAADTGPAGPPDTGSAPETGTGVVDAGDGGATYACGATMTCATGAETCCVQAAGGGGAGVVTTCQMGNVCPNGGSALHCTATADCAAGMDCCVVGGGGMGAAATSMCRAQCANTQLCDPTAADPGCTAPTPSCMRPAAGGAAVAVRLPANVGTCQ